MTELRIDDNKIANAQQFQIEIEAKQKVITTLEQTQQSLNEVLADKDELIDFQKKKIEGLKENAVSETASEDLKEVRDIIAIKDAEVLSSQEEIQRLKQQIAQLNSNNAEDISTQLLSAKAENDTLVKKLEDQITITAKTELALKAQERLIASKVELIENLKQTTPQQSPSSSKSRKNEKHNLTSDNTASTNNQDGEKSPGMEELIVCLSSIVIHGITLDGLLLWADIQRRMVANGRQKL